MTTDQLRAYARLLAHSFHHERDRRRDAAFVEPDLARRFRELNTSEVMHSMGMALFRFEEQVRDL